MQKWVLLFVLLSITTNVAWSQKKTVVIRMKQSYAVINKGLRQGMKEGDRFRLYTPDNPDEYGDVEVIKVLHSISAIKLLRGTVGYKLKIGDVDKVSKSSIVDDLLYNVPDQRDQNITYEEPLIKRKGFIIGLGLGAGYLSNQASGFVYGTLNRATFLTDFKIGYAPTNTLELYYINKVSWWGESGVTLALSLSSVGFSIYPNKQTATGFFLTGGVGLSAVDAPFENVDASYGYGMFGGLGYEFSKHGTIETNLLYTHITDFGVALNSYAIRIMLSILAY